MAEVAEKKVEEISKVADSESSGPEKEEEKSDESVTSNESEEILSQLERDIIRQVEYYFGDANLNRDKFLREQISKDEGEWVPLTVLLTFKRLAALSTDPEVIVDALMKSDEGLLEISEDRTKLRRHPERPMPEHNEERRKDIMSRTIYVKGFPLTTEMSELIEFFAPFQKILNINMRKYLDKPSKTYMFKGSVFVTFEKQSQAQDFIEKEKVLFKERELLRKWQDKYLEEKKEEYKNRSKKNKAKPVVEEKPELPKGTVLFFEGATDIVTRELLRESVDKIDGEWEIAYIEYNKGDKDGHIRFQEANIAAKFLEKLKENKLKLNDDVELTMRTLSEEEEKAFLDKAIEQMKQRRNQNKNKHFNRKRRGGGGNNEKGQEAKKAKNKDE